MSDKATCSKTDVLSLLAKWIVSQSPILPDNLSAIIKEADAYIAKHWKPTAEVQDFVFFETDEKTLYRSLKVLCHRVPLIKDLNLSKVDRENGVKVDDPNRGFMFVSRYDTPNAEYDFVDLGALARNISNDIEKENAYNRDFDARFEAKHGKITVA